jgi:hypothetical protein
MNFYNAGAVALQAIAEVVSAEEGNILVMFLFFLLNLVSSKHFRFSIGFVESNSSYEKTILYMLSFACRSYASCSSEL